MGWFMALAGSKLRQALQAQRLSMRINTAMNMGNIRTAMAGWLIFFLCMLTIRIAAFLISFATLTCSRLSPCWHCRRCCLRLFFSFSKAKYSPAGPRFSKRAAHPRLVEPLKLPSAA